MGGYSFIVPENGLVLKGGLLYYPDAQPDHSNRLERLLDRLNAANDIKDMNYPDAFLHQLKGDKEGQYSVRVSGNWRVFFEFKNGDAHIVDYADYH